MKRGTDAHSLKQAFQHLRTLDYIPQAHTDFFEDITKAHHKAKGVVAKDRVYPTITKKTAKEMLSQGFPLVNFDRMRFKIRPLRSHLKQICSIVKKYEKTKPKHIEAFLKSDYYKKFDVRQFIRRTISGDTEYLKSVCGKTGIDENTLRFMAISLAKPLFEVTAGELRNKVKDDFWWKNYCPVCGSEPFMAKIQSGDGMRILSCSLCGMEWRFSRVKCPFCNNEDQKSLKFFYYHEKDPHRLYVCDKCKRYIKTVDERKIHKGKRIDLVFEDMVTLYLDTLAQERGYASPWLWKQANISQESHTDKCH